jgi:predicted phage-related endonuclease
MNSSSFSQSSFHLLCDQAFWQQLSSLKLNTWKLNQQFQDIYAKFTPKELTKNKNVL